MPTKSEARYRISLTAKDVTTVCSLLVTSDLNDPAIQAALAKFAPLNQQIADGVATISYSTKPRTTLMEQLGAEPADMTFGTQRKFASKEDYWAWCYDKYTTDPITCTNAQQEAAYEHMYLHGLMTEEQEEAFEAGELKA